MLRPRPTTAPDSSPPGQPGHNLQIVREELDPNASDGKYVATSDDLLIGALERVGVPLRYRYARFDGRIDDWIELTGFVPRPGTEAALAVARQVAHNLGGKSLILTGPPGTGKTHLATSILAERARWQSQRAGDSAFAGFESRFVSVPRLLAALRRHIAFGQIEDLDDSHSCDGCRVERLEAAPLLVLDDLGVEKVSDWTIDRLTSLVGARYDAQLGTIVTSNFGLDQLADRGYERIVSRLLEDGPHVQLDASDYRLEVRR